MEKQKTINNISKDNDCVNSGYSVYAKYGEWELLEEHISTQKEAVAWASEVSSKDEVATKIIYKGEVIWESVIK